MSLECTDLLSIISFKIETGKKHQIRAHTSLVLDCPILFDEKYGYKEGLIHSKQLATLVSKFKTDFKE